MILLIIVGSLVWASGSQETEEDTVVVSSGNVTEGEIDVPSNDEIEVWWESLEYESRMSHLKRYLVIVNSTPEVSFPDSVVVVDEKGNAYIKFQSPLELKVSDEEKEYIDYSVEMPELEYKDVVNYDDGWKTKLSWGGGGLGIGLATGLLVWLFYEVFH